LPADRYPTAAQLAFDLKHPDQVKLTERSARLHRDPWLTVLRRRFDSGLLKARMLADYRGEPLPAAIILVAIDLAAINSRLSELLRATARRILDNAPGARIACLNVLKRGRIMLDRSTDEDGENVHVHRLVELKHWAEPLKLGDSAVTFHVLESPDPAAAILDFAVANNVDHIVMGARANSTLRSLLGTVSAEVAANAPCTVTVVRERHQPPAPPAA
jgi:non-specific serine/threonine protein kinase/protein-serine/threonine kinase